MNDSPNNNSVFTMKNDKGMEIECEVLFTFDSEQTKRSYLIYTDHTEDENGALKVYANIYDPTGNNHNLLPLQTEEEWNTVESILNKLVENKEKEDQK